MAHIGLAIEQNMDDEKQKELERYNSASMMLSSRCNPLCGRAAKAQAGAFVISHEIGLGFAWLDEELAAPGPRAFIICMSIAIARKDAYSVEATVAAAERRNCKATVSG